MAKSRGGQEFQAQTRLTQIADTKNAAIATAIPEGAKGRLNFKTREDKQLILQRDFHSLFDPNDNFFKEPYVSREDRDKRKGVTPLRDSFSVRDDS